MKCTREQFECIKPKLKGFINRSLSDFEKLNYLCNFAWGEKDTISNFNSSDYKNFNREVHETWNEKIFLEACGIETKEKTFTITKDQLRQLTDPKLKEWFPEVFETKLEVGKWYKNGDAGYQKSIARVVELHGDNHQFAGYGFDYDEDWVNNIDNTTIWGAHNWIEATEEEVFEALKNEAEKRGFGEKCLFIFDGIQASALCGNDFTFNGNELFLQEGLVFSNGKWATIIQTITKSEAEKLLNKKIIY